MLHPAIATIITVTAITAEDVITATVTAAVTAGEEMTKAEKKRTVRENREGQQPRENRDGRAKQPYRNDNGVIPTADAETTELHARTSLYASLRSVKRLSMI